jgi:hypothetical protein
MRNVVQTHPKGAAISAAFRQLEIRLLLTLLAVSPVVAAWRLDARSRRTIRRGRWRI